MAYTLLIVDDEPDVHILTQASLKRLLFQGEVLNLASVYSGSEAVAYLQAHPETAVILMDIVMEHNQAGLEAVQQIRNNGHHHVRILVRTGQPGDLSERTVVETHPIDGYLTKSDLTHPHLYSSVYVALKHYQELASLQAALTQARHCYIDPH
jgi:CheY-like chemotaxis protein